MKRIIASVAFAALLGAACGQAPTSPSQAMAPSFAATGCNGNGSNNPPTTAGNNNCSNNNNNSNNNTGNNSNNPPTTAP